MILGPRPSIGWLGYFIIGKSLTRMLVMMAVLSVVTLVILRRSKESVNLRYMRPSHFPPPILIVPLPDHENLNAFDACSVEAANRTRKAPVYVYIWSSLVSPSDYWTQMISRMKGIQLSFMDINKVLVSTPIYGMFMNGGWAGKPEWAVWMATGGGLLWTTGGILIPSGVLMTKPIEMNIYGENSGLLVASKNRIRSIAIGNKPHHPLTELILQSIKDFDPKLANEVVFDEEGDFTPLEELLTLQTQDFCGLSLPLDIPESECYDFNVLNGATDIWDFNFTSKEDISFADRTLLRYTGDNYDMTHGSRKILSLFQKYRFNRFCPLVFKELEMLAGDL